ncbi:hypothetical protein K7H22_19025 [Seohaeicola saemankumensis]|uniref:hypothetical protein n=1 Tax=Seohaeicola saemankumensis TaxID=481181 RepID=UPI001E5AAA4D|nr:hypothetical protein [Seohaeicola saemankumensis]MCD1628090.1 hypothetical protein [Seohaeicola saemankumensis]
MSAPITSQIVWRDISIEITFHKCGWKSDFDHIELRVEEGRIIPVTETGYRSHFLPAGIVDEYGGHEALVRAWLDHGAENSDWNRHEAASRQMTLF